MDYPIVAKKPEWVILDIETTGLSFTRDFILEVGAIAVDEDVNVMGALDIVVAPFDRISDYMSDFVRDMHTKSGLIDAVDHGSSYRPAQADARIAEWLGVQGFGPGEVILAGHTVGFDRDFLRAQFPRTAAYLHHRVFDFSAVGVLMNKVGYDIAFVPKEQMPHRAMADALIEMDEYRSMLLALRSDREDAFKYRSLCR